MESSLIKQHTLKPDRLFTINIDRDAMEQLRHRTARCTFHILAGSKKVYVKFPYSKTTDNTSYVNFLRAPYNVSQTAQFNCVKKLHEKQKLMFSGTSQVSHHICQIFLSLLCVFLCVWIWWKKQGCRLLFASHIGHNVIRKEEKKK